MDQIWRTASLLLITVPYRVTWHMCIYMHTSAYLDVASGGLRHDDILFTSRVRRRQRLQRRRRQRWLGCSTKMRMRDRRSAVAAGTKVDYPSVSVGQIVESRHVTLAWASPRASTSPRNTGRRRPTTRPDGSRIRAKSGATRLSAAIAEIIFRKSSVVPTSCGKRDRRNATRSDVVVSRPPPRTFEKKQLSRTCVLNLASFARNLASRINSFPKRRRPSREWPWLDFRSGIDVAGEMPSTTFLANDFARSDEYRSNRKLDHF